MSTATTTDDDAVKILGNTLLFFIIMGLGTCSSAFSGFVVTKLWAWFVAPLGIPTIGIAQAMGLSLIVYFLTVSIPRREGQGKTWAARQFGNLVFHVAGALLTWGLGAAYHAFM